MKRIISLLLAAIIATGMAMTAFAANPKITSQIAAVSGGDVGEKSPGNKIWLPLKKEAFDGATEDLTMADVRTSKITVKHTMKSGAKAVDSVTIKEGSNKIANILITLTDPYTSTKSLDFDASIYIYIDGKRQGFETMVTGTLINDTMEVYADTDYVDLSGGQTVKCEETTGKIEVYLGDGVSIFTRLLKGKEYYGSVMSGPDADDMEVIDEYPDIEDIYTLTTIGLDGSGNIVKLDSSGQSYYVYDKNLEYLGKTSDMLPYSDKYYLSAKKLDVISTDEQTEPEDTDEPEETDENADDNAPMPALSPSRGSNPDTGVSPLLGVAITAGMLSLVVLVTGSVNKGK